MPTLEFLTGFEPGVFSNSGGGLWDSVTGTVGTTIVSETTIVRNGARSVKIAPNGTVAAVLSKTGLASSNYLVARFAVRYDSLPATDVRLFQSAGVNSGWQMLKLTTAGRVRSEGVGLTGTVDTESAVLTSGVWHVVDVLLNFSANLFTTDFRVDGVAASQASGTGTAGTLTGCFVGDDITSHNGTVYIDDLAVSKTLADYPIGDGKVISILPGADGSHNAAANQFDTGDTAGTNITNATTTAFQMVDDALPWTTTRSTTDNIRQDVIGTTNYLEIAPASTPESGTANGVRALLSYSSPTATLNEGGCVVRNSAGTEVTIWGSSAARSDYSEITNFFKGAMVTKPAAGWTPSEVNAIRWRLGYSNDISPVPTWQALMLEADYPITAATVAPPRPTIVSQAVNRANRY